VGLKIFLSDCLKIRKPQNARFEVLMLPHIWQVCSGTGSWSKENVNWVVNYHHQPIISGWWSTYPSEKYVNGEDYPIYYGK
jgi:hypothetical protein